MKPLTRRAFNAAALALGAGSALPAFGRTNVPWGIAVETEPFRADEAYREAIARHAQLVVPMNALKWATLRYEEDVFNFEPADEIVAFAEARDLPVHGHTLLWYGYNPDWLDRISSRRRLVAVLERHVEQVMNHYRGRVRTWDVVNEVVAHDPVRQGRWRDGVWQRVLGPEQVDIAFELAHAADPSARLFLNDYDLEDDTPRARERQDAVLAIVRRLQRRDLPIHAIGMQAHLYAERGIGRENLRHFIRELKELGVGVAITELDIIDWRLPSDPSQRDVLAAAKADEFLGTVFEETTPEFVVTWGLSDRYSWIGETFPRNDDAKARPLPLDADLRPKPMLEVVRRYTG